jgi:NTP pyrophosphatase (non-canonical NTP hydrolase)
LENADMHPHFMGDLANRRDAMGMLAVVAVGKIQPKRRGTGLDQGAECLGRFRGGADRGHDLGASHGKPGQAVEPETTIPSPPHGLVVDLQAYQAATAKTAHYPDVGSNPVYPTLGLCGEAGEVAEKVKKVLRDQGGQFSADSRAALALELGDVLWYLARLASELDLDLGAIAEANLAKLASRVERNVIAGSGDQR